MRARGDAWGPGGAPGGGGVAAPPLTRRHFPAMPRAPMKDSRDDPQAELRRIPTLFAQAESEDGQAPRSRNVPDAPRGGGPRARGPVLQISRLTVLDVQSVVMTGRRVTAGIGLAL